MAKGGPMSTRKRVACAVAVAASLARPLAAHHSFSGVFDGNKVVRIKGVISRFDAVNPHSIMYVDSWADDGSPERWALEGPSILQLSRRGLDKNTALRAGESIEACGYRTKDDVVAPPLDSTGQTVARL